MPNTTKAILVDGEVVGYMPATSAENVSYGSGSVKDALDDLTTTKITLTQADFDWNNSEKAYQSKNAVPFNYNEVKRVTLYCTNGIAILGLYVTSTKYLRVSGIIANTAASIDNTYNFRCIIEY